MNYQTLTNDELVTRFEFSDEPVVKLLAERLRESIAEVEHAETLLAEANDDLEVAEVKLHDFETALDEMSARLRTAA